MFFFDLDGPILDVSEKYHRVYFDIVLLLGGSPLAKDVYWNLKRSRVPDHLILKQSALPSVTLSEFQARRRAIIETPPYAALDRVWPEILTSMPSLLVGQKVFLVTLRNDAQALREELISLQIAEWFDEILSAPGDAAGPDRHQVKVNLVLNKIGKPKTGWFIGDSETDLRAGRALGLRTAAVAFGIRRCELLAKEEPEKTFFSPKEMVGWLEEKKENS